MGNGTEKLVFWLALILTFLPRGEGTAFARLSFIGRPSGKSWRANVHGDDNCFPPLRQQKLGERPGEVARMRKNVVIVNAFAAVAERL